MRLATAAALAFPLAGCANVAQVSDSTAPLAVGDAWTYEVHDGDAVSIRSTCIARSEPASWNGNVTTTYAWWGAIPANAWRHGVQPEAVTWTDASGAPFGWAGLVPVDGGDMLVRRTTQSPCPELPETFEPSASITTECELTFQRVMPWGDTMERQYGRFIRTAILIGTESIEVPAGTFDAWHVTVEDAYPPFEASSKVDLWYAPKACAIIQRVDGDYKEQRAGGSCASTGWSHEAPTPATLPDLTAGDVGRPSTRLSCALNASGAGGAGLMVEQQPAICEPGFHMFSFDGLDSAVVTASWSPTPGVTTLRLHAAGQTAEGTSSPVVLEVPAGDLEDNLASRITMDGAASGLHVGISYEFSRP